MDVVINPIFGLIGMVFATLAAVCIGANLVLFLFSKKSVSNKDEAAAILMPILPVFFPKHGSEKKVSNAKVRAKQGLIFIALSLISFIIGCVWV